MRLRTTLAQGRYHYSCDGRAMPVQDSWQLGEDTEGHRIVISRRLVGEEGFGMEVCARFCEGLVSDFRIRWRDQVGEENARYRLCHDAGQKPRLGDPIAVDWTGPNGPQSASVEGAGRLLFPLMRIFMGPLLLKLETFREGLEVVSPDIVDPSQRGKLLAPRVSHRSARPLAGDAATQGAQELGDNVCGYIYQGEEAERDAHCYVDERGLLVGYDWPSSTGRLWQVRLRDLEWSPKLLRLV
ncbi:hypothetical protein OQJ68_03115 [Microbulbifer thermotolerans]|uniref:Uncharacterized protein n=1 Tax=Microbulbifer thermotolerans TaxID=252514 RepID=A0AB35HTZ7_MICTH|nr:hypothetical protein [Microbulbifer thermotolerans]MCX2800769.1 hypothetical protein [Microbulbifer thermotolerans]